MTTGAGGDVMKLGRGGGAPALLSRGFPSAGRLAEHFGWRVRCNLFAYARVDSASPPVGRQTPAARRSCVLAPGHLI